jgi:trigger factor
VATSTIETLSPTRVRLAVEVPFAELQPAIDAAYKKVGANVRVPGFRPGKVPNRVLDQRVGRSSILEEAINSALPGFYTEAAQEHTVKSLGQPDIEVTKLEDGTEFSFTAEVDVRPEFDLPELDGLAVTVDSTSVGDDEVDEQLASLAERFGTLKGVERPVALGDFVSLDLSAAIDGQELEDGSAKGLSYEVGKDDLIPGLDDALVGKNAGDTAVFPTTLQQGERAGEEAEVTAVVNSVKEKELPALDDDFAQLASEFDTIEELKADLHTKLAQGKAMQQGAQARDKVIEHLVGTVEFPLPESAVQAEVDFREHDVIHQLGHDDALFERYLSVAGKTREEFTAELRENAEKSVRAQFILDAIAEKTEVQISDGELTEYLVRQAARYGMPAQEFANQIVQGGNLPALVADVRRSKALATVLEKASVTDEAGNAVDLSALSPSALADLASAEDEVDEDDALASLASEADHDHDHHGHDHEGHDHEH